jgi:hydroxyacyl-ACP dehydratase HTD2-like protein with hotdog domain
MFSRSECLSENFSKYFVNGIHKIVNGIHNCEWGRHTTVSTSLLVWIARARTNPHRGHSDIGYGIR